MNNATTIPLHTRSKENQYHEAVVQAWNTDDTHDWRHILAPQIVRHNSTLVFPITFENTGFEDAEERILFEEVEKVRALFIQCFDFEVNEIFKTPFKNGRNELLTASGSDTVTYLGDGSFLTMITEDLEKFASESKASSLQTLYNKVVTRSKLYNRSIFSEMQSSRLHQLQEGSSSSIFLWPRSYKDPLVDLDQKQTPFT